ncbi:Mobile element protein (plasmid) [Bacillus cereus]|nr:Mobile element protein [Bacillus cereus]
MEYKTKWYGKKITDVLKIFASSQLCSFGGYSNKDIKNLKLRKLGCPSYLTLHVWDINAIINLKNGAKRLLTARTAELT